VLLPLGNNAKFAHPSQRDYFSKFNVRYRHSLTNTYEKRQIVTTRRIVSILYFFFYFFLLKSESY